MKKPALDDREREAFEAAILEGMKKCRMTTKMELREAAGRLRTDGQRKNEPYSQQALYLLLKKGIAGRGSMRDFSIAAGYRSSTEALRYGEEILRRRQSQNAETLTEGGELDERQSAWREVDRGTGYLISYRGRPIASLKRSFITAKARAGIARRLPLYALRHAFASILLAARADLKSVSEILGHSRPDTTTRIYQHTDRAMHEAAIGMLPAVNVERLTEK